MQTTFADIGQARIVSGSAMLLRKMMEANPADIAFCPFIIFYYEKADLPRTVFVGFRELDDDGSDAPENAKEVINRLLREIIKEASGTS